MHIAPETYGPYTGHQLGDFLKQGRIDQNTHVIATGAEDWIRAGDEKKLAALFKSAAAPPPLSLAAAPGAAVVQVTNNITQPAYFAAAAISEAKSPGVALLLSFLICGAGQMYCGRVGKGVLMLIACILLWLVLLGWTIWIWSMIDAYSTAKRMNMAFLAGLQNRPL